MHEHLTLGLVNGVIGVSDGPNDVHILLKLRKMSRWQQLPHCTLCSSLMLFHRLYKHISTISPLPKHQTCTSIYSPMVQLTTAPGRCQLVLSSNAATAMVQWSMSSGGTCFHSVLSWLYHHHLPTWLHIQQLLSLHSDWEESRWGSPAVAQCVSVSTCRECACRFPGSLPSCGPLNAGLIVIEWVYKGTQTGQLFEGCLVWSTFPQDSIKRESSSLEGMHGSVITL